MLKKIMIAMSCCVVATCGASEKMVQNPIPDIIRVYGGEDQTPIAPKALEAFKKRCDEAEFCKALEKHSNINGFKKLQEKWKMAQKVLKTVCGLKGLADPKLQLEEDSTNLKLQNAFNEISDITNSGFYDASRILLSSVNKNESIHETFNTFWQLLLQAKEIVVWYICTQPEISEDKIPAYCFKVCCMLQTKNDVGDILWAISILGDVKAAICGLDEEGAPTKETIAQAKEEAKGILEKNSYDKAF